MKNPWRTWFACALASVPMLAAAAETIDYYVDETSGGGLAFVPSSVVIGEVKGPGFAPDEHLFAIEVVQTQRSSDGHLQATHQLLMSLCMRRTVLLTPVSEPIPTSNASFDHFVLPTEIHMKRFQTDLCEGHLLKVPWWKAVGKDNLLHVIEGNRQALYSLSGGVGSLAEPYLYALVLQVELGGAQLADGRRFDLRDVVWVLDCKAHTGAVANERLLAFADGGKKFDLNASIGDDTSRQNPAGVDPGKLTYKSPNAGSVQDRFSRYACSLPRAKAP